MMKTGKIGIAVIVCLLLSLTVFQFSEKQVRASQIIKPEDFYFEVNTEQIDAGKEYEMKLPELLLSLTDGGLWDTSTSVQWVSSEPGVVAVENTTYGSNYIKLVRKGPGYSTLTAIVTQGSNTFSVSCLIKVDLLFDAYKTGLTTATTTNEKVLLFDSIKDSNNNNVKKQVFIKYVDYTNDQAQSVSGAAISATAVTWESDNEGVASVDSNGYITAKGSGSAIITATSNTMSSQDRSLKITLKVVVRPVFSLTYDDRSGNHNVVNSVDDVDLVDPAEGVPSDFIITSNATLAKNLKWVVYDTSTGSTINPTGNSKMTYSISNLSGNVSFSNVKAGTYEIYAFADSQYNTGTNIPYAYMKIIVPIDIGNQNIVMTVGDTYSIPGNSNIPGAGIFEYVYEGDPNIAPVDQTTGIISAKMKGNVTLHLVLNQTGQDLYDSSVSIGNIDINITVIDGIALSTTNAVMYTSSTLLLNAIVTDPTQSIEWSSSNTAFATVANGLVTAKKAGTVTITARQTINGIVKKATCQITIQQSVESVTIDPDTITISIGAYKTLHATITPQSLSGVTLKWISSNDKIVKIIEPNALTATIQGVAGGHAVISAVNQDNVVVGYCDVNVLQPVTSVVLSETDVTLKLSQKQLQLRATVYPDNASDQTVNWTTTDSSKARVDQNGLVTLLKPGTVTIVATSADNKSAVAYCNVNIEVPVTSIALDEKTKTMYTGQTAKLAYSVLPTNASNVGVTWTSTDTSVATVDAAGKVTAKGVGTTVIILKTVEGGFSTYCTVTVKSVATGIKFDVTDLKLKTGEFYDIKPTLTPKGSTDSSLIWESSDTKVATVDNNGRVTAKGTGSAIIMARTEAGAIAYCKVTVTQAVQGLLLNYSEKVIYVGNELKLKVSVSPSGASNLGVTWKSSNTKIATVSEDGVVKGLIGGTAVITCTTVDGGYSATCVITVREPVTKITLNHKSYKLGVGKTVTLVATVKSESATNQKVTWKSSNTKVATVNQNGKVTAKSKGWATITATAQDGSDAEASCSIGVVTPVTSVTISKSFLSMLVGDSRTLKATVKPTNATYKKAKWTSSDEKVAIVDDDGVVTALKAGNATITAASQDSSGKKAVCYVTVRDRVPSTSITISDKNIVMVSGEQKVAQISLSPATSTDRYTWSSDNSAVAKVDKYSGKITARATGTAYITVMADSGVTAVIEVTVIGLNVTELTLEQYTNYRLYVEGATSTIRWDISNPAVAVVTNGNISTRSVGTATITATVNGRRLSCKLKVIKIK